MIKNLIATVATPELVIALFILVFVYLIYRNRTIKNLYIDSYLKVILYDIRYTRPYFTMVDIQSRMKLFLSLKGDFDEFGWTVETFLISKYSSNKIKTVWDFQSLVETDIQTKPDTRLQAIFDTALDHESVHARFTALLVTEINKTLGSEDTKQAARIIELAKSKLGTRFKVYQTMDEGLLHLKRIVECV